MLVYKQLQLAFGGYTGPANSNATEEYDGSAWTSVNPMNTARYGVGSAQSGTQTAALAFGGANPAVTAVTEEYDGTSWTNF
jgi:hypothetical protein